MIDRRRTLRLYEPISVTVRGERAEGDRFEFETVARDVGGGGLCAVASRILNTGEKLRFIIQFARAGTRPFHAPIVIAQGVVLRVQELSEGTFLFAAAFTMRGVI